MLKSLTVISLVTFWHGDLVSCRTKSVCSMAHIHPIILCITRCENNDVIQDFDVITDWDLTILCPRVIERTAAGCMASESTEGLYFTHHWWRGIVFKYAWRHCRWRVKIWLFTVLQKVFLSICFYCIKYNDFTVFWLHINKPKNFFCWARKDLGTSLSLQCAGLVSRVEVTVFSVRPHKIWQQETGKLFIPFILYLLSSYSARLCAPCALVTLDCRLRVLKYFLKVKRNGHFLSSSYFTYLLDASTRLFVLYLSPIHAKCYLSSQNFPPFKTQRTCFLFLLENTATKKENNVFNLIIKM